MDKKAIQKLLEKLHKHALSNNGWLSWDFVRDSVCEFRDRES